MSSDSLQNIISLLITDDCINCKACDTICPTNAIYPGGKDYKLNNKKHKAPVKDYYYIVTEKCNFCEEVYAAPECVSICPMDAIIEVKTLKHNNVSYKQSKIIINR
jgi:formate hydrogenlyase subunit 6/NADH:ubiquinone oxidoreductase subunit I